jgi:hypothetical protein
LNDIIKDILILYSKGDKDKQQAMLSGMVCITNLLCQGDGVLTPHELFKTLNDVGGDLGFETARMGS